MKPEDRTAIVLKYGMPPPTPKVLGEVQARKDYFRQLPEYFLIDFEFSKRPNDISWKCAEFEVEEIIEMLHRFDQYEERRASTTNS